MAKSRPNTSKHRRMMGCTYVCMCVWGGHDALQVSLGISRRCGVGLSGRQLAKIFILSLAIENHGVTKLCEGICYRTLLHESMVLRERSEDEQERGLQKVLLAKESREKASRHLKDLAADVFGVCLSLACALFLSLSLIFWASLNLMTSASPECCCC